MVSRKYLSRCHNKICELYKLFYWQNNCLYVYFCWLGHGFWYSRPYKTTTVLGDHWNQKNVPKNYLKIIYLRDNNVKNSKIWCSTRYNFKSSTLYFNHLFELKTEGHITSFTNDTASSMKEGCHWNKLLR